MVGMDGFMPKPVKRDALRLTLEQLEQLGSGGIPPPTLPGVDACTLSSALARQLEDARAGGSLVPAFLVSSCPVLNTTTIQEGRGSKLANLAWFDLLTSEDGKGRGQGLGATGWDR
jgi:hypothetical protein